MSEWSTVALKDIAEINPREYIKKGDIAVKVAMDKLQPFCRDIPEIEYEVFSGGTKFRNGDTIMARITPCLENGKTAMVNVLDDGQVGFGSTEYIVFRAKKGISDPYFLYYLVCSPMVREPAIKSMVGSSGRQRVQTDVVQNLVLSVPSLPEQVKIGEFLKKIDDKIAVNNKINRNLSEQAQAIFQNRFGDNPTGVLADICAYSTERIDVSKLTSETYYSTENMLQGKAGVSIAAGLPSTGKTPRCLKGDTVVSNIRPYFKKIAYCYSEVGCSADVLCFHPKMANASEYLYETLFSDRFFNYMVAGSKGTKMPRGDKQQIMQYPIHVPSNEECASFSAVASPLLQLIHLNQEENKRLELVRDTLLPKLMSGELDISELDL